MELLTHTQSYCAACRTAVPAQTVELNGALYLHSDCPACGSRDTLVEHDAALYRRWESSRRPNTAPENSQKTAERGCPFDCGLCPAHRQKSCIALIEITDSCDLGCPVCYADSGSGSFLPLKTIERMLDSAVESANGKPEILQVSGGEPTTHPQILPILRTAMQRPFKYVMLNTNGLALQDGRIDVAELARLGNGFEVYLQFDGLNDRIYETLRGKALLEEKLRALNLLAEHGIPATLVVTVRRNLNLESVGELLQFAIEHPAVRGINYQCEAYFGRNPEQGIPEERVTQTEIVNVLSQSAGSLVGTEDFIPLSCGLASMVYLEKINKTWQPIPRVLSDAWKGNPLTASVEDLMEAAAGACLCKGGPILEALTKRLPPDLLSRSIEERSRLVHDRFFHLTVSGFLDDWNFDLNRACRECAHVLQPDGTKIPFSAYNTLYREMPRV
ncbi:MAG: radical SAM protein [Pontiellaceae bacterium]|nr:radical SAM protein [Pontiellaceae bacterium]MBN2783513.1 radical SAM protein [Pontiellaceae bacterium]